MFRDLANRRLPCIAFDVDNLLFKETHQRGRLARIFYKFKSERDKYLDRDLDINFILYLRTVWDKGYNIELITRKPFKEDLYRLLDKYEVCYTYLHEVTQQDLEEGKLRYYYFVCNLHNPNISNSITLRELQTMI